VVVVRRPALAAGGLADSSIGACGAVPSYVRSWTVVTKPEIHAEICAGVMV
jgi:hypothetical protein